MLRMFTPRFLRASAHSRSSSPTFRNVGYKLVLARASCGQVAYTYGFTCLSLLIRSPVSLVVAHLWIAAGLSWSIYEVDGCIYVYYKMAQAKDHIV